MPDPAPDAGAAPLRQQVQHQPIPFKTDAAAAAPSGGMLGLLVLLVVGALAWAVLLRERRRAHARQGAGRALRVVETQRLAPRSYVSVVEFGGQRHLLAQNEHGLLHVASTPLDPGAGETT